MKHLRGTSGEDGGRIVGGEGDCKWGAADRSPFKSSGNFQGLKACSKSARAAKLEKRKLRKTQEQVIT
jgi:hypothetical protein